MGSSQLTGVVGGRYEIIGPIASGGMGSVFRARDLILHRTIALKVLRQAPDPAVADRFGVEARNAARLSHPGIVQVYDFGEQDGAPYLVMELVEGATLRSVLRSRGRLSPAEAARIAAQVAHALDHAHRAGIIHRDVKPENILIDEEGRARVADFGLSRVFADPGSTQAGMVFGTAHYLAPEQVTGSESDHRADIYALGVMLFEMLAGRVPFTGDSPTVIAYRRVGEDVPDLREVAPEVPPTLAAIVARATAREVESRYPTAALMADSLRALATSLRDTQPSDGIATDGIPLDGMPTVLIDRQAPNGPVAPAGRTRRRRPKRRTVTLVAGATALAVLYAFTLGPFATAAVPDVEGLSEANARRSLSGRGFGVDIATRHDVKIPEGHVISQTPQGGTRARTSQPVRLFVSLGPLLITLEDVRGETLAEASARLSDAGFTAVTSEEAFHPTSPKGTVISMEPEPGELTEAGAPIVLTVSKGPDLRRVPHVVGDPEGSASADLKAAGFGVTVSRAQSEEVAEGVVISQSPAPGTRAARGSKVKIVVSTGPPLVTAPDLLCMTKAQAEDAAKAAGLKISFEGNKRRVVDQEPAPGTKVRKGSKIKAFMGNGFAC